MTYNVRSVPLRGIVIHCFQGEKLSKEEIKLTEAHTEINQLVSEVWEVIGPRRSAHGAISRGSLFRLQSYCAIPTLSPRLPAEAKKEHIRPTRKQMASEAIGTRVATPQEKKVAVPMVRALPPSPRAEFTATSPDRAIRKTPKRRRP